MGTFQNDVLKELIHMKLIPVPINGLLLIEPSVFKDERGHFLESFNDEKMAAHGIAGKFVQDNQSVSNKGVIRGLHFQKPPHEQGKLVRVVYGRALDVALDLRPGSATFGRHFSVELSGDNNRILWIPPGFAHGFEALENDTVFLYKVTNYYHPASEAGIRFDDPEIGIAWHTRTPVVSEKDRILPTLHEWMSTIQK